MPFQFRFQDLLDILIISALVYQLYRWFRNSRALQVLIGLSLIALLYLITRTLGLFMTSWILQQLGTVLLVLIIVVFQHEIRQALYRMSMLRHAFGARPATNGGDYSELVRGVFACAQSTIGALIVIRGRDPLDEYLSNGVRLDAAVSRDLIETIFYPGSPLHDGAVVIDGGKIAMASCHLPLAQSSELPPGHGTRHRAALGITERTDAVAIVVSEERGTVSVSSGETLTPVASEKELNDLLLGFRSPSTESPQGKKSLRMMLFDDLRTKFAVTVLVVLSWSILTIRQGEIVTVTAPIRYRNVPPQLVMTKGSVDELELQIKIYSNMIPSPSKLDVTAEVDLSKVHAGTNTIPLSADNFRLPLGAVFSQVKPATVRVMMEHKEIRSVAVVPSLSSPPRRGNVMVEPRSVRIEGVSSVVSRLAEIRTEPIDPAELTRNGRVEARVVLPQGVVRVIDSPTVIVQLHR